MNQTWHLPFAWVSDPGGDRFATPLGVWNAAERDGLFYPVVLLVAPDGREVYRHRSRDFADRPDDDDLLAAVRSLRLGAVPTPPPWTPPGVRPQPSAKAFRPEAQSPYFRGIMMNTRALAPRMRDDVDRAEVEQDGRMAASFVEAWRVRREAVGK